MTISTPGQRLARPWSRAGRAAAVAMGAVMLAACSTTSDTGRSSSAPTEPTDPGSRMDADLRPEDAVWTVVVSDEGSSVADGDAWPTLLAGSLADRDAPMTVSTSATEGAGFSATPDFATMIEEEAVGSTQLVILFDSRLQDADPDTVAQAAGLALRAVERASPDAKAVVIGPLQGKEAGTAPPEDVVSALRTVTEDSGALFVDPVADGWPEQPTQQELADLVAPYVESLVQALAASGANR